ncbi:MAG: hypothetical protein RLZZ612_464 [Pseudomonadota bacterium]
MSPHSPASAAPSSPTATTGVWIGRCWDDPSPVTAPQALKHHVLVLDADDTLPDAPPVFLQPCSRQRWQALCTDARRNGFARSNAIDHTLTLALTSPTQDRAATLAALQCRVDHLYIAPDWWQDASAAATTLARLCPREAQLCLIGTGDTASLQAWEKAGFVWDAMATSPTLFDTSTAPFVASRIAHYRPRWPLPTLPSPRRHAIVIGAGLAGAAVCHSLILRGWYVVLIDQASGPAQGASALPVGMMSEHRTARPTPMSQLSRLGMALHRHRLAQDVPIGAGWQPTAITNVPHLRHPDSEDGGEEAYTDTEAALVRPSALVAAWLAMAQASGRCTVLWNAPVCHIEASGTPTEPWWDVVGPQDRTWATSPNVIVTAAFGSADLLAPHAQHIGAGETLRPVKGQLSYGPLEGAALAPHPLRDQGVFVPCYEDRRHPNAPARLWSMGATYERGHTDPTLTPAAHERNAQSLHALHPAAYEQMRAQQQRGDLLGWAGIRCASLDRLPLVGAVPALGPLQPSMQLRDVPRVPGLWTVCAMGSRGLTLAELAAELLAAQLEHEPWPLPRALGQALDPARFALKAARTHKSGDVLKKQSQKS